MHFFNENGEGRLRTPVVASPMMARGILALSPRTNQARPVPLIRGEERLEVQQQLVFNVLYNRGRPAVNRQVPRTNKTTRLRREAILKQIQEARKRRMG